ncbi:hypothetical protein M441DRAFT_459088 [Trichoderma asperellum CBS 433.97]|uniref:C3H1-type domain-containing protein n=1 Tax=Trichoderma asperellum (strain ATCC 204424 / CBS 433.97 / NBRC 101777) TaxID=1042311 RepID=A0A2T3Z5B3_TRIA4|nr:hypothetical protein M441DRAFT_459088 [Trichoderma asperellum CBS 433.97]PTB39984.1 hypothetical protein M441DRAFT_459088 [Trichoderma asperellum CBS 433.97]
MYHPVRSNQQQVAHSRFAKTVTQLLACTCDQSVSHVVGDTVSPCSQQDPGQFDVQADMNRPRVSYWRSAWQQYRGSCPHAIPTGRCTRGRRARYSHKLAAAASTPPRLRPIFIATGNDWAACYWSTLVIEALPLQPSTSGSPREYSHNRSLRPVNAIRQGKAKSQNASKGKKRSTERLRALIGPLGRDVRLVA